MGGLHTNNMKLWGNLYTFPNCSPPTYSHWWIAMNSHEVTKSMDHDLQVSMKPASTWLQSYPDHTNLLQSYSTKLAMMQHVKRVSVCAISHPWIDPKQLEVCTFTDNPQQIWENAINTMQDTIVIIYSRRCFHSKKATTTPAPWKCGVLSLLTLPTCLSITPSESNVSSTFTIQYLCYTRTFHTRIHTLDCLMFCGSHTSRLCCH